MSGDIIVPSLGESVTEAIVAKWHKQVGEAITKDEPIVELESDKVSMDVPSPETGVLKSIAVDVDGTVEIGGVLGSIDVGAVAKDAPAPKAEAAPAAAAAAPSSDKKNPPSVEKKLAENPQLDAGAIAGSGKDGRLTKGDVVNALEDGITSVAATGPRETRVKMTKLRSAIAKRLKDSQNTAAILTTFNDVDMTEVINLRKEYKEAFEKKHDVRLGFMGFFVKAAVQALKEIPEVNAEIDGDEIIYKNHYDIGVAVGTPNGLVVPVVRDADRLSIAGIEAEIMRLALLARDGKLGVKDMQGGTFTVSNGGVYGSMMSTPIINPPQSGILGMHRTEDRPVARNGEVVIRPMMYLAMSYDHRIIDGRESVTFLKHIKENIEDPRRLILGL